MSNGNLALITKQRTFHGEAVSQSLLSVAVLKETYYMRFYFVLSKDFMQHGAYTHTLSTCSPPSFVRIFAAFIGN